MRTNTKEWLWARTGLAILFVALFASSALAATVYRCTDANNQPVYSDSPCGAATVPATPGFSAAGQTRLEAFALQCATNDFNQWVRAQRPPPEPDVRMAKLVEISNLCRRAVHLPDMVAPPPRPTSFQGQAHLPKDAEFTDIVKQGSVERLEAYLRAAKVSVNDRSDLDEALLDHAAELNQLEIARYLIEHGATVDTAQTQGPERGMAPVHRAASADAYEVASLLIASGATVNYHGPLGITPLILAASHGSARTAKLLLEHGANISTPTGDRKTALSEAIANHHPDIVQMLLLHVPTPTAQGMGIVAARADVDGIRLLLQHDALAHDIDGVSKNIALRYAIVGGGDRIAEREQIIDLLIAAGAGVNNTVNNAPNTPVMMVTSPAFAEFLIARGADLNAVGWYGTAANQLACNTNVKDRLGMFKVLLAHHADLTTAATKGKNGVQCALESNRPDLIAFLRTRGVPMDATAAIVPPPAITVTHNGRITNVTAAGNLATTHPVSCRTLETLDNSHTPPDLFQGVKDCIEHDHYAEAVDLFALAGIESRFDAARVTDKTAGDAGEVLILTTFDGMAKEKRDQFGNTIRALNSNPKALAALCNRIRKIGVPAYYPDYMVMHGMGAFTGDPHAKALDPRFDAGAAWSSLQTSYLNCP
jgi:ankyrin repeat protein